MARAFIVQKRRKFILNYIEANQPVSLRELHQACVDNKVQSVSDDQRSYNTLAKDLQHLKEVGALERGCITKAKPDNV